MIWLASYPKSGNTWVRALLSNYMRATNRPININTRLAASSFHLDRDRFDEQTGIESTNLYPDEVERYRTEYHASLVKKFEGSFFSKTHESYFGQFTQKPIFPPHEDVRVIYLIRNPLDIVPSYAHQDAVSFDCIIEHMRDPDARLSRGELAFSEYMGRWDQHVLNWVTQKAIKILVIKYEDLLADPYYYFSKIISFSQLRLQPKRIKMAIQFSNFQTLQTLESNKGFKERQSTTQSFFRKGVAGEGRKCLTAYQTDRIIAEHGHVMKQYNYLSDAGFDGIES